jgi:hypothetical protein
MMHAAATVCLLFGDNSRLSIDVPHLSMAGTIYPLLCLPAYISKHVDVACNAYVRGFLRVGVGARAAKRR